MPRKHSASRISTEAEIALPSLWEIVLTFEEEPDATREASTPFRQEFWPAPLLQRTSAWRDAAVVGG